MASALALRAKVRTPSRHLFPPDFCAADVAGLPGPAEDLHLQLMPAFAPTRIEIVAEARAAVAQGKLERLPDRLMQQRSEEHTSELQSRGQLVCRLLLEKKKKLIA